MEQGTAQIANIKVTVVCRTSCLVSKSVSYPVLVCFTRVFILQIANVMIEAFAKRIRQITHRKTILAFIKGEYRFSGH